MRYSLRNQQKIEKVFGASYLRSLMSDLFRYFGRGDIEVLDCDNRNVVGILSTGVYSFYVLSKKYDVLNLAFKEKLK